METHSFYCPPQVEGRFISSTSIGFPSDQREIIAPQSGGIVSFIGTVRDHNNGKAVLELEYECLNYMAEKMIQEILDEAREKWSLHKVYCKHRVGKVAIGEIAVIVVCASKHRVTAYAANQFIIDRIKQDVPIWKKEIYTDGSYEWGNNCNCSEH